jgi:death-on-curing protein
LARHRPRRIGATRAGDEFGGVEFYPDLFDKAAILCVRLARNHPLPDGNKRVAYLALVEFLGRNGIDWAPPSVDETVRMIEEIAAGRVSARELAEWLRVSQAQG